MNIDNFKNQHRQILQGIDTLRNYTKAGVVANAEAIAQQIVALSSIIKVHLAVEDRVLYPSLQSHAHPDLADMGRRYQDEMKDIASGYMVFSRRWNTAAALAGDPDGFRADANSLLKRVYLRMKKENNHFYPAIEAAAHLAG